MHPLHPRTRRASGAACAALFLIGATACSSDNNGTACTAIFAFITAIAVDASGQPVTGVAVSDTILRTGQGIDIQQIGYIGAAGTITVFTDNYTGNIRMSGDSVRVTGAAAGKSFSAMYEFGTDGCHVRKISGPDTVVVR